MRKKHPSKQAYARHVRGQSGLSSSDRKRGNSRMDDAPEAADLRVSFSSEGDCMVAVLSIFWYRVLFRKQEWLRCLGGEICQAQHVGAGEDALDVTHGGRN